MKPIRLLTRANAGVWVTPLHKALVDAAADGQEYSCILEGPVKEFLLHSETVEVTYPPGTLMIESFSTPPKTP